MPQAETESPNLTLLLTLPQICCVSLDRLLGPSEIPKIWPRPEVKNSNVSSMWCCIPLISALRKQRQVISEF